MNTNELSIATITLARTADEEAQLHRSVKALAMLNMPVFVTDGGSRKEFVRSLKSISGCSVSDTVVAGVFNQARNSLKEAHMAGAPFILYTEPDKHDFFTTGLPAMISAMTTGEDTGIILAERSAAAFATFPSFQQMTETAINNCCEQITFKRADYTYGPFLLNAKLVPYLDEVTNDIGWGWRPCTFGLAVKAGLHIESFTGDFFCPEDQRADDYAERVYRIRQLKENTDGLLRSLRVHVEKLV